MGSQSLRLDVFGREMIVVRESNRWLAYHAAFDGKRRQVDNLVIPSGLTEEEIVMYLADVFHESANEAHPAVTIVDD